MQRAAARFTLPLVLLALITACATDAALTLGPGVYEGAVVEASCGQCQFDLAGESCDLALRIDGKAWFVEGTLIDEHGDAHASNGFCNAIRQARVSGCVVDGRFVVSKFELLPEEDGAAEG